MYISHKYKFIFLRVPKTASSSLSDFFIKNIPDDSAVYTPVPDSKTEGNLDSKIIKKYKKTFRQFHLTLDDLVKERIITRDQALSYRVISVIREPFDRQKSFFYFYAKWRARGKTSNLGTYKKLAPDGFFKEEPNSKLLQSDFCKFEGKYIGEQWLYERLEDHVQEFMRGLGIPIVHPLPKHKAFFRKEKGKNEIVFDQEASRKIKEFFQEDFELYSRLKGET